MFHHSPKVPGAIFIRDAPASKHSKKAVCLSTFQFPEFTPQYYLNHIAKPSQFPVHMALYPFTGFAVVNEMNDDLPFDHDHEPTNFMAEWEERLGSFHTWPLDIKPLPAAMANAGFYHSNIATDTVTCFRCKIDIQDWKKHHDPIQRHLQQSTVFPRCTWLDKVTKQPQYYTPPTPPATPPVPTSAGIPHKCKLCQGIFPSLSSFHRHRRQAHKRKPGPFGERLEWREQALKHPGERFMGRYKVSKAPRQRTRHGRRGNTDLFDSD